jgi:hypothetical protein
VVGTGIDMVHTDRIGAQLGHAGDVALALGCVNKRVRGGQLISNACPSQ